MKFPVLIIKGKQAPLFYCDAKAFGLISKGGESFYDAGTIIDSVGQAYELSRSRTVRKASILKSLVYFQQMYLLEVKFSKSTLFSLIDFKIMLKEHIAKHKAYWVMKEPIKEMNVKIDAMEDFETIMRYLE